MQMISLPERLSRLHDFYGLNAQQLAWLFGVLRAVIAVRRDRGFSSGQPD